jgi:hypothetical protein
MPKSRVRVRRARWFQLAALAAAVEPLSLEAIANEVSRIGRTVSPQPVRDFLSRDMPILVDRTLTFKDPSALGLHVELLLFHTDAANADWFMRRLRGEPLVSRVDALDGLYNVAAEVVADGRAQVNELVERYEAQERLTLVERSDHLKRALESAAERELTH